MSGLKIQPEKSVGAHPLFRSRPEVWKKISHHIHTRRFHKDEAIVHHGDDATGLWVVLHGWVKLTRQTPDGKETIVGLCTDQDMFGEAALFPHASYPYNAESIGGETELVVIPADIIRSVIAEDASVSATIMSLLNERVSQAQLKLEHMSTMSAAQRLGCFLLRLCHNEAQGSKVLQIPVEKLVLAAYLGMKPETLSRSQQQLKSVGISVSGHTITINNIASLREYVCNSCSESGSCEAEQGD